MLGFSVFSFLFCFLWSIFLGAAALQNTQNKFREAFESSCQFAEILNRIYTKNVEMTDWPNVQCNMEYQYAVLNFLETMNKANFVIRQSSQTVVLEKTLQPMHESVTKMGPDIDEICKDRNLKMKDYDSYKRRLKGFEQKKEALEVQLIFIFISILLVFCK